MYPTKCSIIDNKLLSQFISSTNKLYFQLLRFLLKIQQFGQSSSVPTPPDVHINSHNYFKIRDKLWINQYIRLLM